MYRFIMYRASSPIATVACPGLYNAGENRRARPTVGASLDFFHF